MAERDGRELAAAAQAALLDDPEFLRGLVQSAVQAILEAEMDAHLGAGRYERSERRTGYRNGYKPRTLRTRVGTLELDVPQDRDGTFSTEVFSRYQRTEQALVVTLMEMDVQGVSTRKVAAITEQLCGTSFAKSQVSALAGRLDADLAAWRERPLTAAYPYLSVDARSEHVRVDGRVVSQGVLIVAGVRDDGRRELLAVEVADTESEATSQDLFRRAGRADCRASCWSPATTTRACGRRSRGISRERAGSAARSTSPVICKGGSGSSTAPRWRRICAPSSRRRTPPRRGRRRARAARGGGAAILRSRPCWRRSWRTAWRATRRPPPTGCGCARPTAWNGSTRS
jgi:Transposase, Mutator family